MKNSFKHYLFFFALALLLTNCTEDEIANLKPSVQPVEGEMTTLATTDVSLKDVYYFHRGNSSKGIYYGARNTGIAWLIIVLCLEVKKLIKVLQLFSLTISCMYST